MREKENVKENLLEHKLELMSMIMINHLTVLSEIFCSRNRQFILVINQIYQWNCFYKSTLYVTLY